MAVAIIDEVNRARPDAAPVDDSREEPGLVAGAKAGNATAFEEISERHERRNRYSTDTLSGHPRRLASLHFSGRQAPLVRR
jgi:hypothetical protein